MYSVGYFVGVCTWLCEMVAVLLTSCYVTLQLTYTDPVSTLTASNGFCLPSLDTHLYCCHYDVGVFFFYACFCLHRGYHHRTLEVQCCLVLVVLLGHVYGHYLLWGKTSGGSLQAANSFRHWSFTWVLVSINGGYCLPRLALYPINNVKARSKSISASIGIFLLALLAMAERLHCATMAFIGGHLVYDILISVVLVAHTAELMGNDI